MSKRFLVSRVVSVLQATTVEANDSCSAIETSRKLNWSEWKELNRKRRKNYKAEEVSLKS